MLDGVGRLGRDGAWRPADVPEYVIRDTSGKKRHGFTSIRKQTWFRETGDALRGAAYTRTDTYVFLLRVEFLRARAIYSALAKLFFSALRMLVEVLFRNKPDTLFEIQSRNTRYEFDCGLPTDT